jgi:hypothetical protein
MLYKCIIVDTIKYFDKHYGVKQSYYNNKALMPEGKQKILSKIEGITFASVLAIFGYIAFYIVLKVKIK